MKCVKRFFALILSLTLVFCDGLTGSGLKKIHVRINNTPLVVEVASTSKTRNKGLMYRKALPQNQGMLFVWPSSKPRNFWMKNTFIPLDIAFFDDQFFLINIESMKPDNKSGNFGDYKSAEPAKYAIEVNAGWYKKHNIKKFAILSIPKSSTIIGAK